VLAVAGERSRTVSWQELESAAPDIVVAMPCGCDTLAAERAARARLGELAGLAAARIVAVDAAAYFSRPGPRLVDGIELLAHVLHPDRVARPPDDAVRELDLSSLAR
jgi:iron complex transport system substrate-binding protein